MDIIRPINLPAYDKLGIRLERDTIVFDIGGTWFRSAVITKTGKLLGTSRIPSINFKSHPNKNTRELKSDLVNYIIGEYRRLRHQFSAKRPVASISIGAALNAHSGIILNSGPLWGSDSTPFNIKAAISRREHDINCTIINDITASLLRYAHLAENKDLSRLALVTVSSGIGLRTYDIENQTVPIDPEYGLQGEIGHLPVHYQYNRKGLNLTCDCGGDNHLNAFCSGRGIERLLKLIPKLFRNEFQSSYLYKHTKGKIKDVTINHFIQAVIKNDAFALKFLDSITYPLAEKLIHLFTVDPQVQRIIITGGVAHALGGKYLNSLLKCLNIIGLYQISNRDPLFFKKRIVMGIPDDNSGLIGAAIAANLPLYTKPAIHQEKSTWSVQANEKISYEIIETDNIFSTDNKSLLYNPNKERQGEIRRFIVVDKKIFKLYLKQLMKRYLDYQRVRYYIHVIENSERDKNIQNVLKIVQEFDKFSLQRRKEPIIAIGGGVLLDIVGLAASLYRRGTPYIRIPTTLLALVDASIGVKTGVNFKNHRNRIGTYYPPLATFIDRTFLRTLSPRQIRNGIAEILKIAIIKDRELFEIIEKHNALLVKIKFQDKKYAPMVIRLAIKDMVEELQPNLQEHKLERLVDFGHSFSAPLELHRKSQLLHGEAVNIDMALSTVIATNRNLLSSNDRDRIINLMKKLQLPIYHPLCTTKLMTEALKDTTLHRDGLQHIPLPTAIGSGTFANGINLEELSSAINYLKKIS